MIRKVVISDDVIELRRRLVVPSAPGDSAVKRDGGPLIRTQYHVERVCRINPELMIVVASGSASNDAQCLTAVGELIERNVRIVNGIGIVRVDRNAVEIPIAAGKARVLVGESPCVAAVVRAVHAGILGGTDDDIHALPMGTFGDRDSGAAPFAIGKSMALQLRPGIVAVKGAKQSAAGT